MTTPITPPSPAPPSGPSAGPTGPAGPLMTVAARSTAILPIVRAAVKSMNWGPFVKFFILVLLRILPILIPLILMADHAATMGDMALTERDPEVGDYPGPLRDAVLAKRYGTLDES
jgi:hypothetical protein